MASFLADATGHIAIGVQQGELHAVVRANALDGTPFEPGQTVEIADDRLAAMLSELLRPFGVAEVPIDEHRQSPDPRLHDPALPLGR
jgi:hypothetical protein